MEVPARWTPPPRRLDRIGWPTPPGDWGVYRRDRALLVNVAVTAAVAVFLVVAAAR